MVKKLDWGKVGVLVSEIKQQGLTYKEGAGRFGVPLWQLYDYNRRKNQKSREKSEAAIGKEANAQAVSPCSLNENKAKGPDKEEANRADIGSSDGERSQGRGRKRERLPEELVELIAGYKKENPDHGFKRIQELLKGKHLVVVPRKRIREVLKEKGLLEKGDGSFDRTLEEQKGTRRFEALYPRQLWQMDHTNVYIEGVSVLYLILVEDDYSRFCVGSALECSCTGETMIGVLHNAQARYGKPEKILTDQGRAFYTWSMEQSRFQKYLDDMRIEHIVSEPHSPQTLGKVERLNQTVKRELFQKVRFRGYEDAREQIGRYLTYYNYERPHQSLGGARPAERFFGLIGEKERVERELADKRLDFSRGYLILTTGGHTVSVLNGEKTLEVFLDGEILRGGNRHGERD